MAASMSTRPVPRCYKFLLLQQKWMSSKAARLKSSTTVADMKRGITPFWEAMENRRRQASKTILVKLCNRTPISTLLQYCTSHGKVTDHFSYFQQDVRYAVVEFKSPATLQSLLQVTQPARSNNKGRKSAFIHSRFLTFSKPEKRKVKEQRTVLNKGNNHSILMARLCEAGSVSEQIDTFMQQEQLQEPEIQLRFLVCSLLEEAFKNILPDCTLYPFGSSVNSFGKRNCDIDMYLDGGTKDGIVPVAQGKDYKLIYESEAAHSDRIMAQNTLFTLASYLKKDVPHVGSVLKILHATCPLVKFSHHATGLSCDLTANNRLALKSSELLYIYGQLDPRVRPLVFLIRYWARSHGVTSVHPGPWITNFPLTLLVVYFLQTRSPPIVPAMNDLNRLADEEDHMVIQGIDCTLVSDLGSVTHSENEETLEELLRGFFHFLCTFKFHRQGISIKRGEPFPNIDDNHALLIENPFETDLNTSKNVSIEQLRRMQGHAKESLEMMATADFKKSDEGDHPWGVTLLLLPPSNVKNFRKSPWLTKRLGNILGDLKR